MEPSIYQLLLEGALQLLAWGDQDLSNSLFVSTLLMVLCLLTQTRVRSSNVHTTAVITMGEVSWVSVNLSFASISSGNKANTAELKGVHNRGIPLYYHDCTL